MGLCFRTLLICLLVLAVPAQGVAAATMALCGTYHHGLGTSTSAHPVAQTEHAHHGSAAGSGHHQAFAVQADDDTSVQAKVAAPAKAGHDSNHKCSACASCCTFGAILSTVLAVPQPAFAPTVFAAVVPGVEAFAADGPERPPRIVPA